MRSYVGDDPLDEALSLFAKQTGLVFPGQRRRDFAAGARQAMSRRAILDVRALAESLRVDAKLVDELAAELAVHESYFFREPAQYQAIRDLVLPRLTRERPPNAVLDVWSAGCARGEEAYSLAILLDQEGLLQRSRIRGTDISRAALADATRAQYTDWSFRGTAVGLDPRYFRRQGRSFHLASQIRDRVAFEPLNLAAGPYPKTGPEGTGYDLILCRNVLIYFDMATVRDVAQRFHDALNDGGWLILASADPPLWDFAPFELQHTPAGVIYRKRAAKDLGPRRPTAHRSAPIPQVAQDGATVPASPDLRPAQARPAAAHLTEGFAAACELRDCVAHIKALANAEGTVRAEAATAAALSLHPMSPDLHYLRAILLLDQRRWDEAVAAAQYVVYLDRSLIAAHLLLGSTLRLRGDRAAARRAYRNALTLCARHAPDVVAPLTDGETVGRLAALAEVETGALQDLDPPR